MSQRGYGEGDFNLFGCVHRAGDTKLYRYGITTRFSNEDKVRIIDSLLAVIADRASPEIRDFALRGVGIIRQDTGQAPNWQGADQIFADDVLCEICDIISSITDEGIIDTTINSIGEQMKDMIVTNGLCSSGKCNRLFQIYMVLRDMKDGIHLPPDQKKSAQSIG